MEAKIKNIFERVFENYKNLDRCKEIIRDSFKEIKEAQINKIDSEQNSLMNHIITKILRLLNQEKLTV
jgi:hypothetical protein